MRGRLTTARRSALITGSVIGLALCSALAARTAGAVFTASTSSPTNAWTAGTVAISDDDSGTALFVSTTDGSLTGGQTLTRCIKVRYTGTLVGAGTAVRLYASASGGLGAYLNLTVDLGSGGGGGSCTGFAVGTAGVYSGTLGAFAGTYTNFGSGLGGWTPVSNGATLVYRFTVVVQTVSGAQNKTSSAAFTWEAQS